MNYYVRPISEVLDEIEDYLDNLSDVDLDEGQMTANRELRLLQDLRAARKAEAHS